MLRHCHHEWVSDIAVIEHSGRVPKDFEYHRGKRWYTLHGCRNSKIGIDTETATLVIQTII